MSLLRCQLPRKNVFTKDATRLLYTTSQAFAPKNMLSNVKLGGKRPLPRAPKSPPKEPNANVPLAPKTLDLDSFMLPDAPAPAPAPAKPTITRNRYFLHVQASRNNTILHFAEHDGKTVPGGFISSGTLGFKKVQRGQFEAGFQCALKMLSLIDQTVVNERKRADPAQYNGHSLRSSGFPWVEGMSLEVIFKGFGQGRDAFYQALMTGQGENVRGAIEYLQDRTPIKVGGTRSKKARRL